MALVTIKEKSLTPQQIIKTVADSGTPETIAGSTTFTPFSNAIFIGNNAARTANTGTVYLGVTSGNDTQPIPLVPGQVFSISAPTGKQYNLADWYIDVATNDDGVVVIYS